MRPRKLTFRANTILAVATGLAAISAILTTMQYQGYSRTLETEWESKDIEFARMLEVSILPLLESENQAALSAVIAKALLVPSIISVTIIDDEGAIVADSAVRGAGERLILHLESVRQSLEKARSDITWVERRDTGRVRFVLTPIKGALTPGGPVQQTSIQGAMLVGRDLSAMDALIHSNLRYLLFINGMTFAALFVMFWVAIRISVVHPLAALAEAVRTVPGTSLAAGKEGSPADEIGALTETFEQMKTALQSSEQFARTILGSLPTPTAILDKDGYLLTINVMWERFVKEHGDFFPSVGGGTVNYLDACRRPDIGYGNHADEAIEGIRSVLTGSLSRFSLEYLCPLPKEPRWFLLSIISLSRPDSGAVVSHIDITERVGMETHLHEALAEKEHIKNRLNSLYDALPIGLMSVTADFIVERVSRSVAELHGRSREDHLNQWLPNVIPSDRWLRLKPIFEQVLHTGKPNHGVEESLPDNRVPGGMRFLLSNYDPDIKVDGTVRGVHVVTQDITAQKYAQQEHEQHLNELTAKNRELDQMAIRDPLTGLYNRRFFDEALTREWQQFQRSGEAFTVIIMDVDDFKAINDEYGHETGDRALQQVGTALRTNLRESDLIARVGGDEFAALLPRTDTDHCAQVSEKLQDALKKLHLSIMHGEISIALSLGSATVPGYPPATSAAELLRVADKRMYDAKRLASSGRPDAG